MGPRAPHHRGWLVLGILTQLVFSLPIPPAAAAASVPSCDFNADGFADLAVGVPFEAIGAEGRAGAVDVIYGSSGALTSAGSQLWH
jgi:FG-GAP repeat